MSTTTSNGASTTNMDALSEYERAMLDFAAAQAEADQAKARVKTMAPTVARARIAAAVEELIECAHLMRNALAANSDADFLSCYDGSSEGLFYGPINRIKAEVKHLR